MSQIEILKYLYTQRATGNEEYFKPKDISNELNSRFGNGNINNQLRKLFLFDYLEIRYQDRKGLIFSKGFAHCKLFRLKSKYMSKVKALIDKDELTSTNRGVEESINTKEVYEYE